MKNTLFHPDENNIVVYGSFVQKVEPREEAAQGDDTPEREEGDDSEETDFSYSGEDDEYTNDEAEGDDEPLN